MTALPPDPAGVFASDFHRRVAAHLPLPGDDSIRLVDHMSEYPGMFKARKPCWCQEGQVHGTFYKHCHGFNLLYRMDPDEFTPFKSGDELQEILDDLKGEGYVSLGENDEGIVTARLTKKGFEALVGPRVNEPPPLEGAALEAAEAANAVLAEADAKLAEAEKSK